MSNVHALSSDTAFPSNAAGLSRGGSFLVTRRLSRVGEVAPVEVVDYYAFQKMACPPLRGDLFTVYRKPATAVTELDIHANASNLLGGHFAEWVVDGRLVIKDTRSLWSAAANEGT